MPSELEITETLLRRGWRPPELCSDTDVATHAIKTLLNPSFCGIRENLEVEEVGVRYCRWPQNDIRLVIAEVIPSLGAEKMLAACKAACDDISSHLEIDFSFVSSIPEADIVITVDPLGGPLGVLAQCTLVPCGIKRGQFQGSLQADQFETWVWADTPAGLGIDWQRVFAHELLHGCGLPHVTTPRCLMNATYSTTIRTMQPGDVEAMLQLGYRRRAVPKPPETKPGASKRPISTGCSPGQTYTFKGFGVAVDCQ